MNAERPVTVLDSFALLAYLGREPGMGRVQSGLLEAAQGNGEVVMSIINLGEVLYITERELGLPKAQAVLAAVEQLPLQILPASKDAVLSAAHIKANHRLSYADAFAAGAALDTGGTILTGDPEFQAIQGLVKIEWLPTS
jgi:predicted nucleic acid-binding protein